MFPSQGRYHLTAICPRDTYGSHLRLTWLSPKNIIYYCPGFSKTFASVGSVKNLLSCSGTHSKGLALCVYSFLEKYMPCVLIPYCAIIRLVQSSFISNFPILIALFITFAYLSKKIRKCCLFPAKVDFPFLSNLH